MKKYAIKIRRSLIRDAQCISKTGNSSLDTEERSPLQTFV